MLICNILSRTKSSRFQFQQGRSRMQGKRIKTGKELGASGSSGTHPPRANDLKCRFLIRLPPFAWRNSFSGLRPSFWQANGGKGMIVDQQRVAQTYSALGIKMRLPWGRMVLPLFSLTG
jgi:hypothetical protein